VQFTKYTVKDWIEWGKSHRLVDDTNTLQSFLEYQYYVGDQVQSYDEAREEYNNLKNQTPNYDSDYTFNKIGPFYSEVEDEVWGKIRYCERKPSFFPLTKRIIDTLACVYDKSPKRNFIFSKKSDNKEVNLTETNTLTELLFKLIPYGVDDVDALFSKIEKFSLLHGVAGILIEYVKKDGIKQYKDIAYHDGYMRLSPLLAHQIYIAQDIVTKEVVAVNIVNRDKDINDQEITYSRVLTADYDILYIYAYGGKEEIDVQINPLGVIPVVFMNDEMYPDSFWGQGIGNTLVKINRALNDYLAQEQSLIRDQTQQRLFAFNIKNIPRGAANTGAIVKVEDNSPDKDKARIQAITPTADLSAVRQAIDSLFKRAAYSFRLPVEILQTNSSKAIAEARGELKPNYLHSQKRCRVFEDKFWKIYFKVASNYATNYLSEFDLDEVVVDYAGWPVQNLTEMVQLANFLSVSSGLNPTGIPYMTPVDIIKMLSDVSDTEAEKIWANSVNFYQKYLEEKNERDVQGQSTQRDAGSSPESASNNTDSGNKQRDVDVNAEGTDAVSAGSEGSN